MSVGRSVVRLYRTHFHLTKSHELFKMHPLRTRLHQSFASIVFSFQVVELFLVLVCCFFFCSRSVLNCNNTRGCCLFGFIGGNWTFMNRSNLIRTICTISLNINLNQSTHRLEQQTVAIITFCSRFDFCLNFVFA